MNPISPKVTHGATFAILASLLLQVLNDSTPQTLAVFGKYEPIVAGLVPILAFAITAYLKSDPLRVIPETPAQDAAVTARSIGAIDANEARDIALNLVAKSTAPYPVPSELPTIAVTPVA